MHARCLYFYFLLYCFEIFFTDGSIVKSRPLSPHLFVYRIQVSCVMSIVHRMTGAFLFLGLIIFLWLLSLSVIFPDIFTHPEMKSDVIWTFCGMFWTISLYYHMFNGIRHLFWDCGLGFKIRSVNCSGVAVLILSLLFTGLSWLVLLR